jgi:predicted TIM-barrel fold metal-dependent hydrolase
MGFIDAHVHVWTPDTLHYPLAKGYKKEDMKPPSFTPEELFKHTKPAGVSRVNLIQMSYYGFDNSYMLDMIGVHKGVFAGTAVIDPAGPAPQKEMTELAKKGVRAFRVYPGLESGFKPNAGSGKTWLRAPGYARMFAQAARNNQAVSCLIGPDALPDLERMCKAHPGAPVIIDHLCRIGVSGTIDDKDVQALCDMARHKRVMVKVGAFYALGKKKAPHTDLGPLIEKVVKAFGPQRCMWESDCPFQVQGGHTYKDSIELVKSRLTFLSESDREWLLRKTAEKFFFPG